MLHCCGDPPRGRQGAAEGPPVRRLEPPPDLNPLDGSMLHCCGDPPRGRQGAAEGPPVRRFCPRSSPTQAGAGVHGREGPKLGGRPCAAVDRVTGEKCTQRTQGFQSLTGRKAHRLQLAGRPPYSDVTDTMKLRLTPRLYVCPDHFAEGQLL